MKKGLIGKVLILLTAIFIACFALTACELSEPTSASKFYINDNAANALNKDSTTKDQAIDGVTEGIENLRSYLDSEEIATTGYYMGMEFNIDTLNPNTLAGGNFRLKIQAHMYTYPYEDEDGNLIYKYYNPKDGKYYDEPDEEGLYQKVSAQDIHNEVIKKNDIIIEWYNGQTNEILIGMYYDGLNSNSEDPGNVLYLNIQGSKRSFYEFGDTVLYQQLIRLLMSLSVEKLLTAGNLQGDAGTSSIRLLLDATVTDNYKVVLNSPVKSSLFYGIEASLVADTITNFIHGIFEPFEDKVDPLMLKYLGFKFSVMGAAIINSVSSDMQFFTEPDPSGVKDIMTGAYLTFTGAALSDGEIYNYVSDISFDYGTYPPEDMKLDRDYYTPYEYGQYEFTGNLFIPLLNANYDALIRTDMQQYDNSTNNVFMEYRDIANGELMIGAYYRYEKTFVDITGMEYLYGWIDLNQLGFPKVYDESLNLAEALAGLFRAINNGIVSIVDAILSPDKNDKENHLLEEIMKKTTMTEKDPNDVFSKNTETLTVDMVLIKAFLYETGGGSYTTRDIINMLDSMLPYTMDQIAIMLGVANAEIMLDNTYFKLTLNVDTNEITIQMLTNVGRDVNESSLMIFQLDLMPEVVGQKVNIATVNFDGFKPLEQIYTYSATMNGNFIFSTAETVDMSKLLSATIGENSGLNTPYQLPTNAGVTFRLVYDQFVTDHTELDGEGNLIVHKAGRSAFQLQMYLTGGSEETDVIIRLASDDVAFSSDVYDDQPARVGELGYIWVSIECVKDNNVQRIPKVKIREDVFMSSMQAYLDGTSIADDAAELGKNEVNLSITSILFALIEDAYVVAEPEQLEITSSNETLQSIFRVKGLIGNIRVDAGFRKRVDGLQSIKKDYGLYQVGQFENITGNSPYDTSLHSTIPVYFYEDYFNQYPEYVGTYIKLELATEQQIASFGQTVFYRNKNNSSYLEAELVEDLSMYETYVDEDGEVKGVEYIFAGWQQLYDMRIDKKKGFIQVYEFGGKVTVLRENIENSASSFFNDEDANNQDISKVRFSIDKLKFVYRSEIDNKYHYVDYTGEDKIINDIYVRIESGITYIYYLGVIDMMYHEGEARYSYFNSQKALYDDGELVFLYQKTTKDFLFEYDQDSIAITEAAKSQYAPRINGSFMGTIRRYTVVFTTNLRAQLGKIVELTNQEYYSEEDKNHTEPIYDEKGILISEEARPRVLFVLEPCQPLAEETQVNISVLNIPIEILPLPAQFVIAPEHITKRGYMEETEVIIAPGTMGETVFPIRVIITNREIDTNDYVTVFTDESDIATVNVPVVGSIDIDPYDYILAKAEYFIDISNYNPDQLNADGDDPEYLRVYRQKEREFVNKYFENYIFNIYFKYNTSLLSEVDDDNIGKYIVVSYNNEKGDINLEKRDLPTFAFERFSWDFDQYEYGLYTEDKITAVSNTEGQTFTALYLHTYFRGQLIALQVNVSQRILSYIKFDEDDDFDPVAVNGDKQPGDVGYIYGHYVANYFDEESYSLPKNPIFVFTDGANHYYEKTFNMSYIEGLSSTGNYLISDGYSIEWGDPKITNIGINGSYCLEEDELINRPFYIRNVIWGSDGNVEGESDLIVTANGTDITSTSINWHYLLAVYKPIRVSGVYTGEYITIPLIAGTAHDNGFLTTVVRITAECPKLDVATAKDETGAEITESDDFNNGAPIAPSAIDVGSALGYYIIDPLDNDTLYIPSSAVVYFTDKEGKRLNKHRFSNIEWCATFDSNDNPSLTNSNGVQILKLENGRYKFVPSTEDPSMTKIMARIGSEASGYEDITLCVRVLSKDPQDVEFYTGTYKNGVLMTNIERTDIKYSYNSDGSNDVILYSYYVNTFNNFPMPSYIKAYFGLNNERSEYYEVSWRRTDGNANIIFPPNSVCNMVATIGTGDVNIDIYLSVIVANHTISNGGITLTDQINNMYVRVGDADIAEYAKISDILQLNLQEQTLGLYVKDIYTGLEKYVLISVGQKNYANVEAGMIGLYERQSTGVYVLRETLSPYDFTNRIYSVFNITFNPAKAVDFEDLTKLTMTVINAQGTERTNVPISDVAKVTYYYDNSSSSDKLDVKFVSTYSYSDYYPKQNANGKISVYNTETNQTKEYSIQELTFMAVRAELSVNCNEWEIKQFGTTNLDGFGMTIQDIYDYDGGDIILYNPITGEEMEFVDLVLSDGTEIGYRELLYRLNYYNAHRDDRSQSANPIRNKSVAIRNIEGLFSVNRTVRSGYGEEFVESELYKIGLGTREGSYDVRIRLIFDGGYLLTSTSDSVSTLEVESYSDSGYAQYGHNGYIFSEEISLTAEAMKNDGAGVREDFIYGMAQGSGYERLAKWYVEESLVDSIPKGTFITSIPQDVIYAQLLNESERWIRVSALTSQGFRITRRIVLEGTPSSDDLKNFRSTNDIGLFPIDDGTIVIDDIYDRLPMMQYFAGTEYLPKNIKITLAGKGENEDGTSNTRVIDIGNVQWKINPAWYGNTALINGQIVGTSWLDSMTYEGTYNPSTNSDDARPIATAEILGWETVENGVTVRKDSVTITLYISIRTSEIVALPWNTGNLKLDTTTVVENGQKIFYIEADAYNDADSSSMRDGIFGLPQNLITTYRSGKSHTFRNVIYRYNGYEITEIPYNNTGVDIDAFVTMFNNKGISIDPSTINKQQIELIVDVGLSQPLTLRVRFYDKTIESITPVIETDDIVIRSAIMASFERENTAKIEEIYNLLNQTRIRKNIENIYEQAKIIIEKVNGKGWNEVTTYGDPDVENIELNTIYSTNSMWDFAIKKMREYSKDNFVFTAKEINALYEYVIQSYLKIEFTRIFTKQLNTFSSNELSYAVYYKNILESNFDYNTAVREIYRVREYVNNGMWNSDEAEKEYRKIIVSFINTAISVTDSSFTDKLADNSGKRYISPALKEGLLKIFFSKLGIGEAVEDYGAIENNVNMLVDKAKNNSIGKIELRQELQKMISEASNFTTTGFVSDSLKKLINDIVYSNVSSIANLDINVSAIRLSLVTGSDISTRINNIINTAVKNFVTNVYMESLVVREIKKIQKINTEVGVYYIDPYYGYTAVPTKMVINFNEEKGGFCYITDISWINDTVTNNVNYEGNGKNDVYGYLYMWTEIMNNLDRYNSYIIEKIEETIENDTLIKGKTWEQIKVLNVSISNVLLVLESDAMIENYFTAEQIAEMGKEACIIELFKRYKKGMELLNTNEDTLNAAGDLKYSYAKFLFNRAKYTVLYTNVNNVDTKVLQEASLIVVVKNNTLSDRDLRVLDSNGNQVTVVKVGENGTDPFKYSVNDLPNKIRVGDEMYSIIWKDVSINPLGNLGASSHTIYGNIRNSNGQRVSLTLYVDRWEYAGMMKNIGTEENPEYVTLNPLNFYFSDSLKYSAEDSFQVRFNVYTLENGVEKLKEYKTVTFYPEDSEKLINTVDDDEMAQIVDRSNYVIYWDEMALNSASHSHGTSVEGDVALGNARIGMHNLTSLSVGSIGKIPKKGNYLYEDLTIAKIGFVESTDGNVMMGLSGNAIAIASPDTYLPMTANIEINEKNIVYDPSLLQVRVLWNYSYEDALSRLLGFVEYAYKDIEEGARKQYAINIIMDYEGRSPDAQKEMEALAVKYYKERIQTDPYMTEEEILREAKQLLMYEEQYNFAKNPLNLVGGAIIKNATVLIKYGDSDFIRKTSVAVRLLFGDYSPLKYYVDINPTDPDNPDYVVLNNVLSAGDAPTKVYIGVRINYISGTQNAYEAEGAISPYDNIDIEIYKLLQATFGSTDNSAVDLQDMLRRVEATDIVYKKDENGNVAVIDGYVVSESFILNGVRYNSDLIKIKVA